MGKEEGGGTATHLPELSSSNLSSAPIRATSNTCGGVASALVLHADDANEAWYVLAPPLEKGTAIYCRVNSSLVLVATRRSAGPGPPSGPNIVAVC
jgi:hypothetical protein